MTETPGFLSPKTAYVFKLIFGNQRNVDILTDFLKSELDLPIGEYANLVFVDPHLKHEAGHDKAGILDVKALTATGKVIDSEIQIAPHAGIRERTIHYAVRMLAGQIKKDREYAEMRLVINIVITDWNLLDDNDLYHHCFRLHDMSNGALFTDMIEIHTLELPKLPTASDQTPSWAWLRFLLNKRWKEITMLTKENPMILKAGHVLRELSKNERVRLIAESREKPRWDIAAEKAAREEARRKGRQEGIVAVARNLLSTRMAFEAVAAITGLSLAEVASLASGKPRRRLAKDGVARSFRPGLAA